MRHDLPAPAFRLWTLLPVRTHEWQPKKERPTGAAGRPPTWKVQKLRELDGKMSRYEMAELLDISTVTIRRYLGRKKKIA